MARNPQRRPYPRYWSSYGFDALGEVGRNFADPSAEQDVATKRYVDLIASGHRAPVSVIYLVSDLDYLGAPPVITVRGTSYQVNNWGVGFNDGDIIESNGVSWASSTIIVANSGGFAPNGTRAVIHSTAIGTFAGHELQIAEADGAGGWTFTTPNDGDQVAVIGEGSIYENQEFIYDAITPRWVQMSTTIQHNLTAGKQGGITDQYYHLTSAQWTALRGGTTSDASLYHTHRTFETDANGHDHDGVDSRQVDFLNLLNAGFANQSEFYFVSAGKGSDVTGDGTIYNPFETVEHVLSIDAGYPTVILDDTCWAISAIIPTGRAIALVSLNKDWAPSVILSLGLGSSVASFGVTIFDVMETGIGGGEIMLYADTVIIDATMATNTKIVFHYAYNYLPVSPTVLFSAVEGISVNLFEIEEHWTAGIDLKNIGGINNLIDPVLAQDGATKNYTDLKQSLYQFGNGSAIAGNQTGYWSSWGVYTTNNPAETRFPKGVVRQFTANITTNTLATASSLEIMVNGVASGVIIPVPAVTTGIISVMASLVVNDGDRLTVRGVLGGTGGQAIYLKEITVGFSGVVT